MLPLFTRNYLNTAVWFFEQTFLVWANSVFLSSGFIHQPEVLFPWVTKVDFSVEQEL